MQIGGKSKEIARGKSLGKSRFGQDSRSHLKGKAGTSMALSRIALARSATNHWEEKVERRKANWKNGCPSSSLAVTHICDHLAGIYGPSQSSRAWTPVPLR